MEIKPNIPVVYVENLKDFSGKRVQIRGWVYNSRSSGSILFILVRDGTGIVQTVSTKNSLDPEKFELAKRLTQESSIVIWGLVRDDPRAPGGYEIELEDLELVHMAQDYPITPKEHGVAFLMEHRHLWLRSSRQNAILRIRATVIKACRDFLDEQGFLLVDAPILTPAAVEGTTTLFPVDYFGEQAYLSQSGQLYNEAACMAFGRVYCFGPAFRAEKSATRRHLAELWMLEPEAAFYTFEDNLKLQEELVSYVVQTVLEKRQRELQTLKRDIALLKRVTPPFPRITYDQALELLREKGIPLDWGEDFGAPHENAICTSFEKPVFVTHFPAKCKAFYMKPDPDRPEVTLSADLLAPEGYGEIIGGSERIDSLELLEQKLKENNLPKAPYRWYLDLRRYGSVPHSGFGMGIERTVSWICGLEHIRESIPFPRLLEKMYP
ncbi:MAG: asparagine--tRNA ligase [Caldiserica bacterium]|jgi:asparaginyl-tRNA synthetase|nr:asparagine--tRNA ligase [Caldisericota bacterium]MDH7562952.1 asparagine--tRNA ligase [Caldisericota bacterium]